MVLTHKWGGMVMWLRDVLCGASELSCRAIIANRGFGIAVVDFEECVVNKKSSKKSSRCVVKVRLHDALLQKGTRRCLALGADVNTRYRNFLA